MCQLTVDLEEIFFGCGDHSWFGTGAVKPTHGRQPPRFKRTARPDPQRRAPPGEQRWDQREDGRLSRLDRIVRYPDMCHSTKISRKPCTGEPRAQIERGIPKMDPVRLAATRLIKGHLLKTGPLTALTHQARSVAPRKMPRR